MPILLLPKKLQAVPTRLCSHQQEHFIQAMAEVSMFQILGSEPSSMLAVPQKLFHWTPSCSCGTEHPSTESTERWMHSVEVSTDVVGNVCNFEAIGRFLLFFRFPLVIQTTRQNKLCPWLRHRDVLLRTGEVGHHHGHLLKLLSLARFLCEKDNLASGLRARKDMLSVQICCVLENGGREIV